MTSADNRTGVQSDVMLTPAEVASMFRVDPKVVTRWAKTGKLSAIRTLGGHRRYRESEVRALLAGTIRRQLDEQGGPQRKTSPQAVAAGALRGSIEHGSEATVADQRDDEIYLLEDVGTLSTPSTPPQAQASDLHIIRVIAPSLSAPRNSQNDEKQEDESTSAVEVYVDTEDEDVASRVFEAVDALADLLGYGEPYEIEVIRGSLWRRAKAVTKNGVGPEELGARIRNVERVLGTGYSGDRQDGMEERASVVVKNLLESLKDVPRVCVRVGSLLLIKYEERGVPVVLVRTLSQVEIRILERFPEIQRNPVKVLSELATALASDDLVVGTG